LAKPGGMMGIAATMTVLTLIGLVGGYLLGSIPFGLLLTRAAGLGDVRTIGSGNIGATNVLRTGNKKLAAATLVLDCLKGTAAVLLAQTWLGPTPALAAGLGAFLGHVFPVWLGFKGGKGVATYIGALLGLMPLLAGVFCGVWLLVAAVTRYSSLSALIASMAVLGATWMVASPYQSLINRPPMLLVLAVMTALLYIKHRPNIARLAAGTEPKIGAKSV
jgi:acyl phosphate:glycerol-3-phosphate acyltransferase